MKVRLLPSSAGRKSQLQSLTSFIVDDRLAIDGGSLGFALTPKEIGSLRHVIVTHAHSDHIASLPIYIAEAFPTLEAPILIYATSEVVSALRQFIFNDHVWPNFENIQLNNGSGPGLEFRELKPRETVNIDGINVTPIPVNHIVPTVGILVQNEVTAVLFTSDTYTTDEIWKVAAAAGPLKAIFVDISYPNERRELAEASKHLTPELLPAELKKLGRDVEVYAVHIKPTQRDMVIRELMDLGDPRVSIGEVDRVYEW
ncbi:MAG TPA: 3',5'-cyclic-nucleotide phosphodiesterase [Blastocatellia bacterium]|nr:3',5'-cyclic-nucleotide phosphodiesterase [Blastocatellia bacterium]